MPPISTVHLSELGNANRIDSEYYLPKYMENSEKIKRYGYDTLKNLSTINITKGETPLWRGDEYLEQGIPFLRSENLVPVGLDLSNLVFISEGVHKRMGRSKIYPNDVLLAIVGATIGQTGLVTDDYPEYNSNQAIAIVRPKNQQNSAYLSIVLETKFCQLQIERLKGGGSRDNLDLHEVRIIEIPKATKYLLDYCTRSVNEIKNLQRQSKVIYAKAENLLLEESGLKDFELEYELSYVVNLSKASEAHRVDAEYFQPIYDTLINRIKTGGDYCTVRDIQEFNKRGVQPKYTEKGEIKVITSKHLGRTILDYENFDRTNFKEWQENTDAQVKQFDILIYTTGAYIGRTNCFLEKDRVLASNHINILRLKKLNPIYVAVFLNSILGQLQVRKFSSGSAQVELYPSDVSKFVIWRAQNKIQQEIASLVQQSYEARKKAKGLLEDSKKIVEKVIEEGHRA